MPRHKPKLIAIIGPTASGKTALAVELARRFRGEVISADSRQVYRGMDIASGKVTKREMRGIPHSLIDVASPRRTFTAAHYQKLGKISIKKILTNGKLPIVAGGTGFYVDSLLYNYLLPSVKPDLKLRRSLEKLSTAELFRRLQKLDPRRAKNIDRNNPRRLVRAIEIVRSTNQPVPDRESALRRVSDYDVLKIGLAVPPERLKQNISVRLAKRLRQGMIDEVRRLHERDHLSWARLDGFGLEYRYASRYLRGMITKREMIDAIKKESWQYAKRQMTWFKRDAGVHWIKNAGQATVLAKKFIKKDDPHGIV